LSLRAPLGGAVPTTLHPRLTVLLGTTTSDRLALQSVFRALVGDGASRLEAVAEVNGVTVTVDDAFADTFATRGTLDPVLVIGDPAPAGPRDQEENRLDPLRAEQRSLAGEMEVVQRELGMPPAGTAATGVGALPSWAPLVDVLAESLSARGGAMADTMELADRLDQLAGPEHADRERVEALEQLLAECRQALDAVRAPAPSAPVFDPTRLAALEQVREEMLSVATARPGRRQRQRLEQLRATEARLLAELGQPSYVSLLAALATGTSPGRSDPLRRAREAVLVELESFLVERLADSLGGGARHRLMADAAAALGEPAADLEGRNPRLVAARLRALPQGDLTDAVRVAAALEREIGMDTTVARTPAQVLELARARLSAQQERPWELGGRDDRTERLEQRRRDLASRLSEVTEALAARERAAAVELREASGAGEVVDLAGAVHGARSISVVGAMPLLLLESARRPAAGAGVDLPDPLTVAAMSAVTQLVWVTDRPEVAVAAAGLGDLAEVIQV
jgi:hypothetical protein